MIEKWTIKEMHKVNKNLGKMKIVFQGFINQKKCGHKNFFKKILEINKNINLKYLRELESNSSFGRNLNIVPFINASLQPFFEYLSNKFQKFTKIQDEVVLSQSVFTVNTKAKKIQEAVKKTRYKNNYLNFLSFLLYAVIFFNFF